jgi:hypothetical protein
MQPGKVVVHSEVASPMQLGVGVGKTKNKKGATLEQLCRVLACAGKVHEVMAALRTVPAHQLLGEESAAQDVRVGMDKSTWAFDHHCCGSCSCGCVAQCGALGSRSSV